MLSHLKIAIRHYPMHQSLRVAIGIIGSITATVYPLSAEARPHPDRTGICCFFRGEKQEITEPCVISTGYGAGAHYAGLHWSDGVKTVVNMINTCPEPNFDTSGFCFYTVDDYRAVPYERDVFFSPTQAQSDENLSCFKVIKSQNSVCYRFN